MPTLSVTKNYAAAATLTQAMLDAAFTSLETFLNTTKIDSNNIQTGGIATANYAALSVDTAALAAGAVTTAKITDANVTTAKIADSNVTTAKIADAAVTQAKRAALGQQVSSSSGQYFSNVTGFADITNLTVTITTTGRPVEIYLIPDGSTSVSFIGSDGGATGNTDFKCLRDSTLVGLSRIHILPSAHDVVIPPGAIRFLDIPSAGTYVYKLQRDFTAGMTAYVYYCKLVAFEL